MNQERPLQKRGLFLVQINSDFLYNWITMKKLLITFLLVLLFLTACGKTPAVTLNIPPVPNAMDEKQFYTQLSTTWIAEKNHDLLQLVDIYRKLVELYPANDAIRLNLLKHVMDRDLKLIIEDRNAQDGLKVALALDEVIPNDFYIQNRIIAAYRIMAEDAMAKKDWKTAEDLLLKKALALRFDIEAMRTYLKLLMEEAKEAIANNKPDVAKKYLQDALMIVSIEENQKTYAEEAKQIASLLSRIK